MVFLEQNIRGLCTKFGLDFESFLADFQVESVTEIPLVELEAITEEYELDLLKEENHVIDCGIGLGNILFDIYLQSKEIDKKFLFTGVDKQKVYINFILDNLSHLWKDSITLKNDDIMNLNYSPYSIIYSYSPFNNRVQLQLMYQKIISEIDSGSIIVEHANKGLGHFNLLEEFNQLEKIDLGQLYVFRKL